MEDRFMRKSYVEGSAVRKIQSIPERKGLEVVRPEEEVKRTSRQKAAARNRQRELRMSPKYVLFLTALTVATALVCFQYIGLQASIMNRNERIIELKSEINTLSSRNDAVEYSISSFIDTKNVIKVATTELGMVKAKKDQVSYYTSSESEYMKQVADIPTK